VVAATRSPSKRACPESDSRRALSSPPLCRGGFRASPSEGDRLGSTPSRESTPLVLAAPGAGLRIRLIRFNSERGVCGIGST
jgi:hypothetical protein